MAKKKADNEEVIVDVQEVYSKTENFVENNKKTLSMVLGGIVVVIAAIAFYTKVYLPPIEAEAQAEMFWAEKYFEKDSLNQAINGDGLHSGFIDIIDTYGGTKSENLAHYYLGICYRNSGSYEDAIYELEQFSSDDVMISAVALGAIGDCYAELNDLDNASSYYEKAANHKANDLTTPVYLFKAGVAYEDAGNFEKAVEKYSAIKTDYASSNEARTIDKYIARAEALK
jgi:tetratricopeptide (TPR) repeat protein